MTLCQGALETEPLSFIYTTYPSREAAQQFSKEMVRAGYAACVNIIEAVTSVYISDSKLCVESEVAVLIKTTYLVRDKAMAFVEKNHPYTIPAVITWDGQCNQAFAAWMNARCQHGIA